MGIKLLILGILLQFLIPPVCAQDLIFYTKDYQPLRGEINASPSIDQLILSSPSGPIQIKTEELLAILLLEDHSQFLKLLQTTNFKALNRQSAFKPSSLTEQLDAQAWQKLTTLFSGKDENTFIILGYHLHKEGHIDSLKIYKSSEDLTLDANIKEFISQKKLSGLRQDYTGDWIPGFIVLNPAIIQQYGYLANLSQKLHSERITISTDQSCSYRIRLLYDTSGNLVHYKLLGSKQSDNSITKCTLSNNDPIVKYFTTTPLNAPSAFLKKGLMGLSVWVENHHTRINFDPEFVVDSINSTSHEFIISQMNPLFIKDFKRMQKQEKVKLDKRNTRYARYLITFAQSSWPHLKAVKLTSPSGDTAFDNVCTKTLVGLNLPKLPPILNSLEQEMVFKCELWGYD